MLTSAATELHLLEPTDYNAIDNGYYARFITKCMSLFSFTSHVSIHNIPCEITDEILRSTPVASHIANTGHRTQNEGS
jgi:hypothetical protein